MKMKGATYLNMVFILLGGLLFSCGQEGDFPGNDGDKSSLPTGEPVTVNFTVNENSFSPVTIRKWADSPPWGELERALQEEDAPVKLRADQLSTGIKIRVIAYESPGTTTVSYADYEVAAGGVLIPDGTPPMVVPAGAYRFVAYSYNNTDPMPAFADMTAAIDTCDLLWGETPAPVTVGPANHTVYILLEHWFSQIKLHVKLNHAVGNTIQEINFATVNHTYPTLEVSTGNLIAGTSSQIPSDWSSGINTATDWYSIEHHVFTGGGPPVVTIGSVKIDGTTHTGPSGTWTLTYNTPLASGHEYTLYIYFTADGIICGDLESPTSTPWGDY